MCELKEFVIKSKLNFNIERNTLFRDEYHQRMLALTVNLLSNSLINGNYELVKDMRKPLTDYKFFIKKSPINTTTDVAKIISHYSKLLLTDSAGCFIEQ